MTDGASRAESPAGAMMMLDRNMKMTRATALLAAVAGSLARSVGKLATADGRFTEGR